MVEAEGSTMLAIMLSMALLSSGAKQRKARLKMFCSALLGVPMDVDVVRMLKLKMRACTKKRGA